MNNDVITPGNLSALTANEVNFMLKKYNREKKVLTYVGLAFLLFALGGPYLPSKVFTNPRPPYYPSVLFHLLSWALVYLIPLRNFFLLRRDKKLMKKQHSYVMIINKNVYKGIMSETYKIKVTGTTIKPIEIIVNQEVYDTVKMKENLLISYTPHSKTVLDVVKAGRL